MTGSGEPTLRSLEGRIAAQVTRTLSPAPARTRGCGPDAGSFAPLAGEPLMLAYRLLDIYVVGDISCPRLSFAPACSTASATTAALPSWSSSWTAPAGSATSSRP